MTDSNVLVFRGSRNIGYNATVRLLGKSHCLYAQVFLTSWQTSVTFLSLRSPSAFDKDEAVQGYVKPGKAHLVKGDGLVEEDVKRAWGESGKDRTVDTVLFTVGM